MQAPYQFRSNAFHDAKANLYPPFPFGSTDFVTQPIFECNHAFCMSQQLFSLRRGPDSIRMPDDQNNSEILFQKPKLAT